MALSSGALERLSITFPITQAGRNLQSLQGFEQAWNKKAVIKQTKEILRWVLLKKLLRRYCCVGFIFSLPFLGDYIIN
jgi:hypothetical protein